MILTILVCRTVSDIPLFVYLYVIYLNDLHGLRLRFVIHNTW